MLLISFRQIFWRIESCQPNKADCPCKSCQEYCGVGLPGYVTPRCPNLWINMAIKLLISRVKQSRTIILSARQALPLQLICSDSREVKQRLRSRPKDTPTLHSSVLILPGERWRSGNKIKSLELPTNKIQWRNPKQPVT